MRRYLRKDEPQNNPAGQHLTPPPPTLMQHPLFSPQGGSAGMLTAENPVAKVHIEGGNRALSAHLQKLGIKHEITTGRYGNPENSFIVYGANRDQMRDLGKKFGQESVLYSENGKHELIYTNGPNEGKHHPGNGQHQFSSTNDFGDYYTHIPGHGYVRLGIDFDSLKPVQQSVQKAESPLLIRTKPQSNNRTETRSKTSTMANEKTIGLPEICKGLADTLKDRVEKFQKSVEELKARELKKTEKVKKNASQGYGPSPGVPSMDQESAQDPSMAQGESPAGIRGTPAGAIKAKAVRGTPAEKIKATLKNETCATHGKDLEKCGSSCGMKKDELIDTNHRGDRDKRYHDTGHDGVLPSDKPIKDVTPDGHGSGGEIKKLKKLAKGILAPGMAKPKLPGLTPPKGAGTSVAQVNHEMKGFKSLASNPTAMPGGKLTNPKATGIKPAGGPPPIPAAAKKPVGAPAMKGEKKMAKAIVGASHAMRSAGIKSPAQAPVSTAKPNLGPAPSIPGLNAPGAKVVPTHETQHAAAINAPAKQKFVPRQINAQQALAEDKKAGGVGFLNNLISKFKRPVVDAEAMEHGKGSIQNNMRNKRNAADTSPVRTRHSMGSLGRAMGALARGEADPNGPKTMDEYRAEKDKAHGGKKAPMKKDGIRETGDKKKGDKCPECGKNPCICGDTPNTKKGLMTSNHNRSLI